MEFLIFDTADGRKDLNIDCFSFLVGESSSRTAVVRCLLSVVSCPEAFYQNPGKTKDICAPTS